MDPDAAFCLSITYDIEMCTNFPYWTSVWDHRKGALDPDTRRYVEKLAEIAVESGVKLQWFCLGSSLDDPDRDYLLRLAAGGHALGNHTYRHVNVKARTWDQLQVTYRRDPSLANSIASPLEAIRAEIATTSDRMEEVLGVRPRGFRTPGGFSNGLQDVPEVQELLRNQGFAYASAHYRYPVEPGSRPSWEELRIAMRWSLIHLQPYRYPSGLLEIPMMGISDVWAFRVLDLEREEWIRLLEAGVDLAAGEGLVFSVLMHPQVLAVRDPHAATLRRLLEKAREKRGRVVTNDALAIPGGLSGQPL